MVFSFIKFFHVILVPFFIIVYMVVCFVCFCLILLIMYFYCCVYVFLLLCMFCIFCFHRANWHSSVTLTEVSVLFPQLQGKLQGITRKDGARPALFPVR